MSEALLKAIDFNSMITKVDAAVKHSQSLRATSTLLIHRINLHSDERARLVDRVANESFVRSSNTRKQK